MDIGVVIAPIGALVGVAVGSWLSRRNETDRWVREQRLMLYSELIDLVTAVNRQFATEVRVSALSTTATESGHDFEGVELLWQDRLTELEHLERRLSLLGGAVRSVYAQTVEPVVIRYLDAIDESPAPHEWDAIVASGHQAIDALTEAARTDLSIP